MDKVVSLDAPDEGFEVLVVSAGDERPAHALVDIWYPKFSDDRQPYVDIDLVHVRANSCHVRVWFDGDANEWVVQTIGQYVDSDDVPEKYRQPWVVREVRLDAGEGDVPE